MNADAFTKYMLNSKSCNKYLGNFAINAQCFCCAKPSSDNCCCNSKKDICFDPCETVKKEFINVSPNCNGRLLVLHVNLKNICPNKMIVVGVLIYENNKLYALKVKKIHTGDFHDCKCRDLNAGKFYFVFKDDELCKKREFKVKVMSNYIKF